MARLRLPPPCPPRDGRERHSCSHHSSHLALGYRVADEHTAAATHKHPATAREREVLRLLAQGTDNQAIADTLIISLPTAKTHVARILAKLQAANRTEAVARARELGLI